MIYLARHGETTWNAEGRYQGRLESELSPLGVRQAKALAAYFAGRVQRRESVPIRVISSPMKRCTATAAFSAEVLGLRVETDPRLIEIAHGHWEGRLRDDIAATDAHQYAAWRSEPGNVTFAGGESLRDVRARWQSFANDLPNNGCDLLVCTHDAVIRVALLAIEQLPPLDFWNVKAENGAFALIQNTSTKLRVVEECVNRHLASERANPGLQAL